LTGMAIVGWGIAVYWLAIDAYMELMGGSGGLSQWPWVSSLGQPITWCVRFTELFEVCNWAPVIDPSLGIYDAFGR